MTRFEDSFATDLQSEIPLLWRFARSISTSSEAADDLMQTALERALRNRRQYVHGTKLRSWLFAIARNAQLDEFRKVERRGHHVPIEEWYEQATAAPAARPGQELVSGWRWPKSPQSVTKYPLAPLSSP